LRILFVTQVFYPDTVAVSQHLWDLARHLKKGGHVVSVYSSMYPYENKGVRYPKCEIIDGINIYRLNQSKLGKANIVFRIIDFVSFNLNTSFKLFFTNKKQFDVVLGTTVPPLLPFIVATICKIKHIPFYYWVMDLQPELSIASELIKQKSLIAKFFTKIGNYSVKNSSKLFSLDKYMTQYLVSRGAEPTNIFTIPVWPVVEQLYKGGREENPFRIEHNFTDKIVIMYSGNHAYVHPLNTLLEAAKILKNDKRFIFVFIGEGVRKNDVAHFKETNKLTNIIQLPFQPRTNIHLSLGSADIQVVIMGERLVGFTHPNKIYGALFIGKPIIYIGPEQSHITDIIQDLKGNISVKHGESVKLAEALACFAFLDQDKRDEIGERNFLFAQQHLNPENLKNKMLLAIEK